MRHTRGAMDEVAAISLGVIAVVILIGVVLGSGA